MVERAKGFWKGRRYILTRCRASHFGIDHVAKMSIVVIDMCRPRMRGFPDTAECLEFLGFHDIRNPDVCFHVQ